MIFSDTDKPRISENWGSRNDARILEQKKHLIDKERQVSDEFPVVFVMPKDFPAGGNRNLPPVMGTGMLLCSDGRTEMLVKPTSNVTLCEQASSQAAFIVENVFEGVMGVWNSDTLQSFNHPLREFFKDTLHFNCFDFVKCHQQEKMCLKEVITYYGTINEVSLDGPLQNGIFPESYDQL